MSIPYHVMDIMSCHNIMSWMGLVLAPQIQVAVELGDRRLEVHASRLAEGLPLGFKLLTKKQVVTETQH